MKILLIDNFDSFTYNLKHIAESNKHVIVDVVRNNDLKLEEANKYDKIILSPGPGLPEQAGVTCDVIRAFKSSKPILGVCLGHQAIGIVFGAKLINMPNVLHGKSTETVIVDESEVIFKGLPQRIHTARYHSWMVSQENLPECFKVTAADNEGRIMAMRHNQFDLCGIQFHPESILTPHGQLMMNNWLMI